MKAIVAARPGGPEVLEMIQLDAPVADEGEVEVRVQAFGLNRVESLYRQGSYGTLAPGRALGIEAVGEVVRDTTGRMDPGQRVATLMGGMMFARHGSYAERIAVPASNVIPIGSDLAAERLAALPEAYLTVWGAIDTRPALVSGESLLVRGGTSSVGLAAIAMGKARGLTVLATTRRPEGRAALEAAGADHAIIDKGTIHEEVRALVPEGVNRALEIVGASTLRDTLQGVRPFGHVALIGLLGGPPVLENFSIAGELPSSVRLSFFSSSTLGTPELPLDDAPLPWIAEQVARGAIPETLARVFPFDEIQDAHRLLDAGTAGGKIVVRC